MNKISSKHFMFFIIAASTVSLRSYSSIFVNDGKQDTWLIFLLSALIILFYFLFLLSICKKTDTYDILEIFKSNNSKFLSSILLFMFSIGLLLSSIECSSVGSSSIHTNYFLKTPVWYCLLFFIATAAYVLCRDINSILILVLVTVAFSLCGDILFYLMVGKYLNPHYLLPIFKGGITWSKISCFLSTLGAFSSIVIIFPFFKSIVKKENLKKSSITGILISTVLILISFISVISFFGPERCSNIFYPEYVQSQRVQIAGFIEFGEIFYILRSVSMYFIKYILCSYGILFLYKGKIKNRNIFIIIYSIFTFLISYLVSSNQYVMFYLLKILQYCNLLFLVIIPFIAFIIFNIRFSKDNINN